MYARIRKQFSPTALTLSVIAIVLALTGGAVAASKYVTKKEAEKIAKTQAKKYANSNPGAPGPAGKDGINGTNGTNGADGKEGPEGKAGKDGTNGKDGTSVTNTAVPTSSATCNHQGGAEFKVGAGSPTTACNGVTGFTATLPPKETETGTWAVSGTAIEGAQLYLVGPISFSIPLAEPADTVVLLSAEQTASSTTTPVQGCEYKSTDPEATPVAPPGTLCVFTLVEEGGTPTAITFSRVTGAFVRVSPTSLETAEEAVPGIAQDYGVWAVTAAE